MVRLTRCLLVLFLATLAGCATSTSSGAAVSAQTGAAPDFALSSLEGRTVRLSDYLGKVVVLDFWATWCTPCLAEIPHLQSLYEAHEKEGLVILGLSIDGPETLSNVAPMVRRYALTFPILLDDETRVLAQYNPARDAPFAVIIDREGKVVERRTGYQPGDEKSLEARLVELLGGASSP